MTESLAEAGLHRKFPLHIVVC